MDGTVTLMLFLIAQVDSDLPPQGPTDRDRSGGHGALDQLVNNGLWIEDQMRRTVEASDSRTICADG